MRPRPDPKWPTRIDQFANPRPRKPRLAPVAQISLGLLLLIVLTMSCFALADCFGVDLSQVPS